MTDLQRLVDAARSRPEPTAGKVPTFAISDDAAGEQALDSLLEYFGADRSRTAVRLVVAGEEVGYVARQDLYGRAIVLDRGLPFGGSAGANVPGASTSGSVLVLRCPVPGCPEPPVLTMSYDEDHPPHCAVHGDRVLLLDDA